MNETKEVLRHFTDWRLIDPDGYYAEKQLRRQVAFSMGYHEEQDSEGYWTLYAPDGQPVNFGMSLIGLTNTWQGNFPNLPQWSEKVKDALGLLEAISKSDDNPVEVVIRLNGGVYSIYNGFEEFTHADLPIAACQAWLSWRERTY